MDGDGRATGLAEEQLVWGVEYGDDGFSAEVDGFEAC